LAESPVLIRFFGQSQDSKSRKEKNEVIVMAFFTKEVIVVPYDLQWPRSFEILKNHIQTVLKDIAIAIEHVGSTAVPGLAAKPIIDCDVVIKRGDLPHLESLLEPFGFSNLGDLGIPERYAFQGPDLGFKYHLYVVYPDSAPYLEHITLRDTLRIRPDLCDEYAALKVRLAERHRFDIDAYIEGKTALIKQILRQTQTKY
jgi:GrpB-like predicted nucleotidyltransferase (UPF0157 family)